MVIVRRMKGGSYILAELDGAISKLQFAMFRIITYSARNPACITGMNDTELDHIANEDNIEPEEEEPEDALDV
jgi:hypothetical protein